ncbi:putative arabinose efflux permease, MFS family [Fodinibius salinus]|uniref:Putative arabinose efflux permease, MFS family n=1 Tax=Fodinibius salinus TaxID=860790 RepID=A0A5D3YNX6_9BACT|nr:MFS transporter [Fodinibius salinus]TYP93859.1 putative arabinose efflux permease, MFS family [Fodinibius salinus]
MPLKDKLIKTLGINKGVLALSVARMADAMGNSILFILIPLYVAKLPSNFVDFPVPILVGILISLFGFIAAIFQPVMGALSDKLNMRKKLIQAGLGLIGISTLFFIFADNFIHLLILRTLQGLGVAITIPAVLSLMTLITERSTRGGSMGVYSTFRIIGFAIGPVVGGYLQVHYGFDAAFYLGSGFIILSMLLVQSWVKEVKIETDKEVTRHLKVFDLSLYGDGILTAALATFAMACCFSMVTTLENEFNARLEMTAIGFSIAFSMLMVGRLISQVPLGHFSDKFGRKPFILGGLAIMGLTTIIMGEVQTLTQLIIVRLLQGIAAAGVAAPAFALAADLSKTGGEGRQMSVVTMGFGLGIAVGPLFAGLLTVFFFELPFIVIGIATIIGTWIVYKRMPETVQRESTVFSYGMPPAE